MALEGDGLRQEILLTVFFQQKCFSEAGDHDQLCFPSPNSHTQKEASTLSKRCRVPSSLPEPAYAMVVNEALLLELKTFWCGQNI